jgi:hypothetical protein
MTSPGKFKEVAWSSAIIAAAIALGALLAFRHLGEAIWQDEAVTIINFSSDGVLYPFFHYTTANSHMAFSAALAAWTTLFPEGAEAYELRLLPFGLFVLAIGLVYVAGHRIAGKWCGALASLLFATSPVAENFSTQLRGYGPSWPFMALLLLSAVQSSAASHRNVWRGIYAFSALVAIAILPTNLYFCIVVAASVAVASYRLGSGARESATTIWLLGIPPACLLIAYGLVWDDLTLARKVASSPWNRPDLLRSWIQGTSADLAWLVPIAAGLTVAAIWTAFRTRDREVRRTVLMTSGLLAGLPIALYAMPLAPFPRTLVPYLPVWSCAVAALATVGFRSLRNSQAATASIVVIAIGFLLLAIGRPLPKCRGIAAPASAFHYDLCHQYFRDKYDPEAALRAWIGFGNEDLPIVTDFEGFYALRILSRGLPVVEFRHYEEQGPPPIFVTHGPAELQAMRAAVRLGHVPYREIADTGYFHVYAPAR